MDSLEEKQKAFEARMINRGEKGDEVKKINSHEKKRERERMIREREATKLVKQGQPPDGKGVPDWIIMKGSTIANHLNQMQQLVERYSNQAKSAPVMFPGTAFGQKMSQAMARVAREVSVVFRVLVSQMDQDNAEARKAGFHNANEQRDSSQNPPNGERKEAKGEQ